MGVGLECEVPSGGPTSAILAAAETDLLERRIPSLEAAEWETLVSAWLEIHESVQAHLWALSKLAAQVEARYGEDSFGAFAGEVGYSARRVYEFAYTYKNWLDKRPSQILSFSHHTIAARSKDPQAAIVQAETNRYSTRQLSEEIAANPALKRDKPRREVRYGLDEEVQECPTCHGRGRVRKS